MNTYYPGDSIDLEALLTLNGVADPDVETTAVTAAIVALDKKTILVGPITAVVEDPATAKVSVPFTSAQTAPLAAGKYYVEFKGTRTGGKIIHWGMTPIALAPTAMT